MLKISRVALIGFGEVGQLLAVDLMGAGICRLAAFDIQFEDVGSGPSQAAIQHLVHRARNGVEAARDADLVISAVTAAQSLEAARSVVAGLAHNTFFLDLNSVSPGMRRQTADVVSAAEGRYVEAAVMAPFSDKRIASQMLLGGPHAEAFAQDAAPLGFVPKVFSSEIGQASAAKMCRSVVTKGIEALLMESMLTARRNGVEKTVLASLSDLLPAGDWEDFVHDMISRSVEHGTRRSEEMREASKTVSEAGVIPLMSISTAETQAGSARRKLALDKPTLGEMLDSILAQIDGRPGKLCDH